MPPRMVSFDAGLIFHLLCRGHNRNPIFYDTEDYLHFLQGMKRFLLPVVDILVYCLMPNHYPLLVRIRDHVQDPGLLSNAMQRLIISHTSYMNRKYGRSGALFQGRFQSRQITEHAYLRTVCIFIHGNPVKDGLVSQPEDWIYSNYREWIGQRDGTLVNRRFIEEYFDSSGKYAGWVHEALRVKRPT